MTVGYVAGMNDTLGQEEITKNMSFKCFEPLKGLLTLVFSLGKQFSKKRAVLYTKMTQNARCQPLSPANERLHYCKQRLL